MVVIFIFTFNVNGKALTAYATAISNVTAVGPQMA